MPTVQPASAATRDGIASAPVFDYEVSWMRAPIETFQGVSQQRFQDMIAPYCIHGKNVPVDVPKGWRRVEGQLPGQMLYVHMDTQTVAKFPHEIFDRSRESWITRNGEAIKPEQLESVDRHVAEGYKVAKVLTKHISNEDARAKEVEKLAKLEARDLGHVTETIAAPVMKKDAEPVADAPAAVPAAAPAATAAPVAPVGEPLPVALLFPGQGSQYVKMLGDVKGLPAVKRMLDQAEEILGYDLLEICLKGPESELEQTRICQPAMYVAGLAGLEKLRMDKPEKVDRVQAVAGLSLGEYTALTVAGVFDFETGFRLVKLRGEAMQEAADASEQSMLSVAGLDMEVLKKLCEDSRTGDEVCQIANFLFPQGFSCAGSSAAVRRLQDKAKDAGCLQAKLLKTSGGFHTSLMAPAKVRLLQALRDIEPTMRPPRCDVYMNVTGKKIGPATPASEIIEMLGEQLTSCVLWEPCCKEMISDGVTEFYECGPMKQLKAMMKRINADAFKQTSSVSV